MCAALSGWAIRIAVRPQYRATSRFGVSRRRGIAADAALVVAMGSVAVLTMVELDMMPARMAGAAAILALAVRIAAMRRSPAAPATLADRGRYPKLSGAAPPARR